jgi:hypothetical protein
MHTVRLQSVKSEEKTKADGSVFIAMGVHTPGLIRWAKAGFDPRKPSLAHDMAASFGLKPEVMVALFTGEVEYTVEGDEVVFQWPDDPNTKESE